MSLAATTIAVLYKNRWQVELFFKWIKQHLRIKHFFGTSENAVKTKIWSAVCTYVLIAIIKKELQLDASLYTCLQILSVCILEKAEFLCALPPNGYIMEIRDKSNQLILFSTKPNSSVAQCIYTKAKLAVKLTATLLEISEGVYLSSRQKRWMRNPCSN